MVVLGVQGLPLSTMGASNMMTYNEVKEMALRSVVLCYRGYVLRLQETWLRCGNCNCALNRLRVVHKRLRTPFDL